MTSACFSRGHTGFSRNATVVATVNPPALAGGVFNCVNQQSFRNWGQGVGKDAGAWGEDAIRNITGQASGANSVGPCYSGEGAIYRGEVQGNATYRNGSYGGYLMFDASRVVPTGPENVPPHVWQPVVLYLGRPT